MAISKIKQNVNETLKKTDPETLRLLGDICFLGGFFSIFASIGIWAIKRADEDKAHAERFGIFVGLWAPTFFIIANRFEHYAERLEEHLDEPSES